SLLRHGVQLVGWLVLKWTFPIPSTFSMRRSRAIWTRKNAISMNKYRKSVFFTLSRKNRRLLRRCSMLRSEYDREQSQVRLGDDFGQIVSLSSEQALMLFRWLSQ